MSPLFTINQSDNNTSARSGVLHTDHGDIATPCFMPVGTYGAIKTQSSEEIVNLPSPILLSNTYHLYLRPGIEVLKKAGFILDFTLDQTNEKKTKFSIDLKYKSGSPVINNIERISKPGRRFYSSAQSIPKIKNGLGIAIVSTPKGVMTDTEARKARVGGEIICKVF